MRSRSILPERDAEHPTRRSLAVERRALGNPGRVFALVVVSTLLVVVFALGLGRRRFDRAIQETVEHLYADAVSPADETYTEADLDGLPGPAHRYFETVLEEGQPYVRTVRLAQEGTLRLGKTDASWNRFEATQYVSTRPPAFVWDATVDFSPLLAARVLDSYARGEGVLRARLLSAIPVASAGPSPAMNESELVRYLGEAVWYPTALLPANGVEWEAVDDRTATATIEHRGVTASLEFHFDENDQVERVTTERYRQEDDAFAPWSGYFRDYEGRNGRRIPTTAEVAWNLADGDRPYWRAKVTDVDHHAGVPWPAPN